MANSSSSISFDRAADIYDATRALPDHVAEALTAQLLEELAAVRAEHVLEVGVGTGRISRPLAERGVRVAGVDISPRMLERLVAQVGVRDVQPDVILGDATHLPLRDGSFRAALSFHVLHLVPDWEIAVHELRRAVTDDGAIIHYQRRDEFAKWKDSAEKWNAMLRARGFERRKRPSTDEIDGAFEALGGTRRIEEVAVEEERLTPRGMVEVTRARQHSWSWEIPDDVFWECFEEYEKWVPEHFGDMDEPVVDRIVHELRIWRFV